MPSLAATVDLLQLFGEPTRVRLAALLAAQELSVAELTELLDVAQSRVSSHLARLREAGVLRDRREGASTYYALAAEAMPAAARRVWDTVVGALDDELLARDRARAERLVRRRQEAWPERWAGEMERHWSPGRTWESLARGLTGLVRLGDVLDVGAGDGTIAELLAPRARRWVCLDRSERMIAAARRRLARQERVACATGDAQALPFPDGSFDAVLLFHVLTEVPEPARALAEAARVLRPRGLLAAITLDAHDHLDVTARYGHRHAGFPPATLRKLLRRAGLDVATCEVTSRERREPRLQVITACAEKPAR